MLFIVAKTATIFIFVRVGQLPFTVKFPIEKITFILSFSEMILTSSAHLISDPLAYISIAVSFSESTKSPLKPIFKLSIICKVALVN
jgi:hypothetical protein